MAVWGHIAECLARDGACALVTVAGAEGSTPREAGARMVVTRDGGFYGTIGGGTLELETIRHAARAVVFGAASFEMRRVSLGPDLGQCCGGRADLAVEVLTAAALDDARAFADLERGGSVFTTEVVFTGSGAPSRRLCERVADVPFSLETDEKSGNRLIVEQFGERQRVLYLFGAGHVGRALVLALAALPFEVVWIDSRRDQFPGPVPANVRKVVSEMPAAELETAPDGAFVLVMTHSHALDEDIVARALLQQRFAYCGVIGSATKRARFHKRLKSRGLNDTVLAKMVCPVGDVRVRSKQPAGIAAGIAVDLLIRDEADHQQAAAGGGLAQKHIHGQ